MAGSPPYYDNYRWGGPGGLRFPQEAYPATVALVKETDINVGGAGTTNTINLSLDQTRSSYYVITNPGSGATTVVWPAVLPGLVVTVYNNTNQSSKWMVTGKTGITVATTKTAMLVMDSGTGDLKRLTADI